MTATIEGDEPSMPASRGKFPNKIEYFLTALSYAVGLGNVWRFPYLAYKNGGGSFFIPYIFALVFLGLPFFFFESTLGQFTSLGPIEIWRLSPFFKGIGYAMFIMGALLSVYYNVIVAWSIYYSYASFTVLPDVPWAHCGNEWNTINCVEMGAKSKLLLNESLSLASNSSINSSIIELKSASPSQEYFYNHVLNISSGIDEIGGIQYHLAICLAVAWLMVYFGLLFGAKSLGKISYFTAVFPYLMITVLLIQGLQLEGAMTGIKHYMTPDFSKLLSIDVWADAATQIFFSLSICVGGVITLASYNPYYNNTIRDSIIVVVSNSLTSIYAGFAIFSVIGFMAHQIDKPINEAADHGVGLAFIAYPAALAKVSMAPGLSFVFFFMLITLGFGSQMTGVESFIVPIMDFCPSLQKRRPLVLGIVCFVMYLCGLPMCTRAGIYILQLMDTYALPYSAFIIGFFELIAIAWVYGLDKHFDNIHKMMGFALAPRAYWKFLFKYACPALIAGMLIAIIARFQPLTYNTYVYPYWADIVGWSLTLISVSMIPLYMIYQLLCVWTGRKTYSQIFAPEEDAPQTKRQRSILAVDSHARLGITTCNSLKGQINQSYIATEFDSNGNYKNGNSNGV